MGKPFMLDTEDEITLRTALTVLLRFRPGLQEVPTGCTEKYGSLKTASRIAMQLSPHFPHVIDFDVGRIRVHRTPYSEDAFTVLTKPTEIKNLCMVACEEHGINRRRFRRNWTLIRRHVQEALEEKKRA